MEIILSPSSHLSLDRAHQLTAVEASPALLNELFCQYDRSKYRNSAAETKPARVEESRYDRGSEGVWSSISASEAGALYSGARRNYALSNSMSTSEPKLHPFLLTSTLLELFANFRRKIMSKQTFLPELQLQY